MTARKPSGVGWLSYDELVNQREEGLYKWIHCSAPTCTGYAEVKFSNMEHVGKYAWYKRVGPLSDVPGSALLEPDQYYDPQASQVLHFSYLNHRGELGNRRVVPIRMFFGSTEFYPVPGWMIEAFDLDRLQFREFSVQHIVGGFGKQNMIIPQGE